MGAQTTKPRDGRFFRFLDYLFGGWRFASFMLSVLFLLSAFMLALLFIPESIPGLGAIATDFKVWCFNYDPATGAYDWAYVAVMILNPLMLAGIVYGIWKQPLKEALSAHRVSVLLQAGLAALLVAAMIGSFYVLANDADGTSRQLAFPAERMRTHLTPPQFSFVNQEGETVVLEDLKGRVVMVTGVYANCHSACPMIITQAKRALGELKASELEDVTVVAITLDPENDTPERLAMTAKAHQLEAPGFNFVTGDPDRVNEVLDQFNFSRKKNPETGVIDHSNMFVLIDRDGEIAYRLTLSDRHENWLHNALRTLVRETGSNS